VVSAGLLILRLVAGLTIASHGAQKLLGWFDGPGMGGVRGMMAQMGVKPAPLWAYAVALTELFGGLLVALGLLTPIAALLVFADLLIATTVHISKGFFNQKGGYEYPLVFATVFFALAAIGPGIYSLDVALGIDLVSMPVFVGTLMVVLAGCVAAMTSRHIVPSAAGRQSQAPAAGR